MSLVRRLCQEEHFQRMCSYSCEVIESNTTSPTKMLGKIYRVNKTAFAKTQEPNNKNIIAKGKIERQLERNKISQDAKNLNRTIESKKAKNKDNIIANKKYEIILQRCSAAGEIFTDNEFPASSASLFCSEQTRDLQESDKEQFLKGARSITGWLRPDSIRMRGEELDWVIISDPLPSDIYQGEIGNCWFVAALALIAERKELLSKILITTKINKTGAYLVRLFKDGEWTEVIVDDLLPCDSFQRLVFSSCRRKQLWVPLIEKAMAKLHGSYESLQSGSIWDGLNYLTGFVSERIYLKSQEDRELLWGRLLSFYSSGFLMGASITTARNIEKIYEEKGLVANHVYSILQVACYEKTRLIQLRNPWGRFSWKGEWSDTSSLWSDSMRRKFSPNQSQEGIFWMSLNTFMRYFTCIDVCKIRQSWATYSLGGILPPSADQDCQPIYELKCEEKTCEVDISLYQSSKRDSQKLVKLTDIGFLVFECEKKSGETTLTRVIKLVKSAQRRCITTSIMLQRGRYCIIPFSFGNWTFNENEELFHSFTLTIHSSYEVMFRAIKPSNIPFALADAMILCAKTYGKEKRYQKQGAYDDITTVSVNLGLGYCTVIENDSNNYLEFQMNSKTNPNYTSTRNSFDTCDIVAPHHRQVVQVLTAVDSKKPGRISNSYQLQLLYEDRSDNYHSPVLSQRVFGLHSPRPINKLSTREII